MVRFGPRSDPPSPGGQAVARRSAPGRESGTQPPQQEANPMNDPDKDAKYRELLAQTGARKDTGKEENAS